MTIQLGEAGFCGPYPLGQQAVFNEVVEPVANNLGPPPVIAAKPTAAAFPGRLQELRQSATNDGATARVPMRDIFALAKAFIDMTRADIEVLLEQAEHDVRVPNGLAGSPQVDVGATSP